MRRLTCRYTTMSSWVTSGHQALIVILYKRALRRRSLHFQVSVTTLATLNEYTTGRRDALRQCEHHVCERRRKWKLHQVAPTSHTGATIGTIMNSIVCAFAPSIMIALKRDDRTTSEVDLHIVHAQEIVFFRSIYIHKSTDTRLFVTLHVILRRGRSKYIPSWTVSAHSGVQPVKKGPSTIEPLRGGVQLPQQMK